MCYPKYNAESYVRAAATKPALFSPRCASSERARKPRCFLLHFPRTLNLFISIKKKALFTLLLVQLSPSAALHLSSRGRGTPEVPIPAHPRSDSDKRLCLRDQQILAFPLMDFIERQHRKKVLLNC